MNSSTKKKALFTLCASALIAGSIGLLHSPQVPVEQTSGVEWQGANSLSSVTRGDAAGESAGDPSLDALATFEWASVDAGRFPLDSAEIIEWKYLNGKVEALVKVADAHTDVWLTVAKNAVGKWELEQEAFVGEYVFYTPDFRSNPAIAAIAGSFTDLKENDVVTQVSVAADGLDEVIAVHDWLMAATETLEVSRNSLVYPASATNDPDYYNSWIAAKLEMDLVWERFGHNPHGAGRRIVIAVIDNGVKDSGDFHFWKNEAEIAGNGIDDDANGYVDDVDGWNTLFWNNDVSYAGSHGTTVSKLAASISGNGKATASPASSASLMRVLYAGAQLGSLWSSMDAMIYAIRNKADVINCSFVSKDQSFYHRIVQGAAAINSIVVAAAGNDNKDLSTISVYPAKVVEPNLVCVGASNSSDARANSNFGKDWVHLFAPAGATSYSAPLVTSTVALLKALKPEAPYAEIMDALMNGVESSTSLANISKSGGRLNVRKAVESLMQINLSEPLPVEPEIVVPPTITELQVSSSFVEVVVENAVLSNLEIHFSREGGEYNVWTKGAELVDGKLVLSGLLEGATYAFRVRVIDNNNESQWIETGNFTTPVYMERSEKKAQPVHYWQLTPSSTGVIRDFGTAKTDLIFESGSFSAGITGALAGTFSPSSSPLIISDRSNLSAAPVTEMTVAVWIRPTDEALNAISAVFETGDYWRGLNIISDRGFLMANGWNRPAAESAWNGTTLIGGQLLINEWNHIAVVLDAGSSIEDEGFKLFLNGLLVASGPASQLYSNPGSSAIGGVVGQTVYRNRTVQSLDPLSAEVDSLAIWHSSFNSSDIEALILNFR